ncbi:MAG: hypothetical protein K2Y56_08135 [Methylobacterium sp.]|uniref:hypothetical protein n=1 Tax=Methylobacterium sp. TaxID=409 RepID=UPI0025D21DE8|nr:hypothetical protein [Methylobacterium sp.]MBX9931494.1 hypothetical protein [Methylobacterium sp.]
MVSRHLNRFVRGGLAAAALTLAGLASGGAQAAPLPAASVLVGQPAEAGIVPVQYGWGRHDDYGYRRGWGGHHRHRGWGHRDHGWGHRHHHHGHRHGGHRGYYRY